MPTSAGLDETGPVDLPEAAWAHIAGVLPSRYLRALRASCIGLRDLLDSATLSAVDVYAPETHRTGTLVTTPSLASCHTDHGLALTKSSTPPPPGTLAASSLVYPASGMGQLMFGMPFTAPTPRSQTTVFPRVRRLRMSDDQGAEDQDLANLRDGFLRFSQVGSRDLAMCPAGCKA